MFVFKSTYEAALKETKDQRWISSNRLKALERLEQTLEQKEQKIAELLYEVSERDGLITLLREQIAVLEGHVSKAVKSTERPVGSSVMQRAIEHQRQQLRLNREQKESL